MCLTLRLQKEQAYNKYRCTAAYAPVAIPMGVSEIVKVLGVQVDNKFSLHWRCEERFSPDFHDNTIFPRHSFIYIRHIRTIKGPYKSGSERAFSFPHSEGTAGIGD